MEELKKRYEELYAKMATSKDVSRMKAFGSRGPKWPFTVFSQTVEAFGGKISDEPFYNKYAMWVTANMIYSDHATTLSSIVSDAEMPKLVYQLAVENLKDSDRPDFIRNYFGV